MRFTFTSVLYCFCLSSLNAQESDYLVQLDNYYLNGNSYFYTNKDSVYYYYDKAKNLAKEHDEIEYLIEVLISENWSANFHYDLDVINKNLSELDAVIKANKDRIDKSPEKNYFNNSITYSKALYDYELKNYEKSIENFKSVTAAIENIPDSLTGPTLSSLYVGGNTFIGKIYRDEGKYALSKEYYNKSLRFLNASGENNPDPNASNAIYMLLSDIYKEEKNYALSNATIVKALDYYLKNTQNSNRIITSYQNIIDNHVQLKQLDSASFYLGKMKLQLTDNHPFSYRYHLANSEIFKAKNDFSSTQEELNKALMLNKKKWNSNANIETAQIYNKIGLLQSQFKNPSQAITNYDNAIEQLSTKSQLNKATLIKVLKNKAQELNTIQSNGTFLESLKTVDFGIGTLDSLKPTFQNTVDKSVLVEDAFPLFEAGIEAAFELYKGSNNTSYIDKAFKYFEKSKNVLLFEALLSAKATKYGVIPESVLDQEKQLKAQLIHIETKANEVKEISNALQDELFETHKKYRDFIQSIETKYQSYYNLKYNTNVLSIQQLQELLKSDELFISYFYGNEHIYIISISKNSKQIHRVELNVLLETEIVKVYDLLNNPKSDVSVLAKSSYRLYERIMKNALENNSAYKLIINADGLLNYIPFSSLNTSKSGINYLIQDYSVSYVNSASLLAQLNEKKSTNKKLLAFAPSFQSGNNSRHSLLPLPNNKNEVKTILDYFKGKSYTDMQATATEFFKELPNYGILHLATHAIIDDTTPENSFLAFTPSPNDEDIIYARELYNLDLQNVSLVTLSACESGIGNLKRGEGFMSLARGFYFSGASSISSTLWKINDASSTTLMEGFYRHLSEGETKDMALQSAQKEFLDANSQNPLSHPYYWSAFVVSGNTDAIVSHNYWIWILGGGLMLIAILLFFRRKKSF